MGGDLLAEFSISTKVGYFPGGSRCNDHSLDPTRLRQAVETAVADLGRPPEVLLLHNPEMSLTGGVRDLQGDQFAVACAQLQDLTDAGWCGAWGISSWDPRPLLQTLDGQPLVPAPQVLMVRAGLLVRAGVLAAGEQLADLLGVPPPGRWGMSPFAGSVCAPVWEQVDPRIFLDAEQGDVTRIAAAFAVAGQVPPVSRVAVGTSSVAHLHELVHASALRVDPDQVSRYRALLSSSIAASRSASRAAGASSGPP